MISGFQNEKELQEFMLSHSWCKIYEKGEYYEYNFHSKEKRPMPQQPILTGGNCHLKGASEDSLPSHF